MASMIRVMAMKKRIFLAIVRELKFSGRKGSGGVVMGLNGDSEAGEGNGDSFGGSRATVEDMPYVGDIFWRGKGME